MIQFFIFIFLFFVIISFIKRKKMFQTYIRWKGDDDNGDDRDDKVEDNKNDDDGKHDDDGCATCNN